MASSSSRPPPGKVETGGCSSSGGGGGGGETSEAVAAAATGAVMVGPIPGGGGAGDELAMYRGLKKAKKERGCTAKERISKMPPCTAGKRSSIYRGVTRHRWTGRYEAHLWDKSTWNQNQNKKGKQVYLGAYDDEEAAARAYDLAALKYWGPGTLINFPVTDYTRDLEEMQNFSREDYLASLRRKSSGFSRGVSKYRPLSSRWDPQFGQFSGADYFTSIRYGAADDATAENEYIGGFCIDRKFDLTTYIKWWGTNKPRQVDPHAKSSEETSYRPGEDMSSELKSVELTAKPTEPYEMPRLGVPQEGKHRKGAVSAMSILSQSAAFKSLQEKGLKKKAIDENDENEDKNVINKKDYGKGVEKCSHDGGNERVGAGLGMTGGLPVPRNVYPLTPLLTAPLVTNYNSIDSLNDPVLWTSLVSVLPVGSSRTSEVAKNESSSEYNLFQQEG
ncbi:AP2-like ethylene-responsive transcription factor At2g41710 isoform X1 [Coffea eugenioides]|uniref:AP2-like ethylene-responsive transcription factor At2g41710 isoform X1 n=1 Tax=Coffea arabica TaxID=13443 RepID=A0A6P6UH52_COFAR|nr:AP2-like ethylene-responsive transcription factor At2g41710 [Coffea arabica]XP_027184637.1 AP2-like ethylene-responsive transcription factor At2g41710 isoform X1 [Coffea eugenioides]